MAMTLAMDREPEVARFIDTYKFDQDMAAKRDRFGGGTSLPLNSDGYEDKQRALRDERHKDWLVQQDKPKEPVYYRVGTPEQGFPGLGEYERQRQDKNIARQKEYNEMLKKQRQAEQQKQEARRYAPQARPAQPLGPQMDYNAAGELAKAEERKAYQDYMGNWRTDQINAPHKPYMDYWENQRFLKEERRREYNELLEKKAKEERYWALRGRPVTPPGGLNIGQYDRQVKEQAPQKKQEYKRMLDEQQKEHMFLRARQEPEMAVIDRNAQSSQFLANKPPPGPSYGRGRDESSRQTPAFWNEGKQAQGPTSLSSVASRSNQSSAYVPMNEKRKHESEVFQQQHGGKPAEIVKNPFYSSDDYEKFQKELKKKQEIEYSEFLSKQYQPNKDAQGLPLGQYKYEPMRLHLEAERNKEYNELLEKQNSPRVPKQVDGPQGLNIDVSYHREKQEWLEKQRNKDYNEYLKKQKVAHPGRRHEFVDSANGPYGGLFHGLGEHGNRSDDLNRERHREYNEKLEQQYAGRDRPGGRPKWVQESLPNNTDRGRSPMKTQPPTDQYQQMLNEKRREEANMRRYEDPEYQDRLAHGRDRGEAGQRYGY